MKPAKFIRILKSDNIVAIASKYIGVLLTFALQVVFLRLVATDTYGIYIQLLAWANIVGTFCAVGQMTYLTKHLAVIDRDQITARALPVIGHSFAMVSVVSLGACLLMVVLLAKSYDFGTGEIADHSTLVLILAVLVALQRLLSGITRGFGQAVFEVFSLNVTKPLLQLLFVAVCLFAIPEYELGVDTLLMIFLSSLLLVVLGLIFKAFLHYRQSKTAGNKVSSKIDSSQGIEALSSSPQGWWFRKTHLLESGQFTLLNTITAIEKNVDVLIVGSVLGAHEAGVYGFVTRMFRLVNIAQTTLNAVFGSKAARKSSVKDYAGLKRQMRTVTRLNVANTIVLAIVFYFGAQLVFDYVNPDLGIGFVPLMILSCFGIIRNFAGPMSIAANMTGNQGHALKITVSTLTVGSVLIYILTKHFGLVGTASAVSFMLVSRAWLLRFMLAKKIPSAFSLSR